MIVLHFMNYQSFVGLSIKKSFVIFFLSISFFVDGQKMGFFHKEIHQMVLGDLSDVQLNILDIDSVLIVDAEHPFSRGEGKPGWKGKLRLYKMKGVIKSYLMGKWYHYTMLEDDTLVDSFDFYSENGQYLGNKTYLKNGVLHSKETIDDSDDERFLFKLTRYSFLKTGVVSDSTILYSRKKIVAFDPWKHFKEK